jgi:prepilin-type N-terminal cleavage/methylation domain-containing protein
MSSRKRTPLPGFTLIEVLVVIAILLILMAFLLPAVQKVRESASRTRCAHQLSQVTLAIHQYHQDYRRFPTGGRSCCSPCTYDASGKPLDPPHQMCGWAFQILPYIDQYNVHGSSDYLNVVAPALIDTYFCPSRRPPTRNSYPNAWPGYGLLDYATPMPGRWDGDVMEVQAYPIDQLYGIMVRSLPEMAPALWRVDLSDISDGASNTILLGEKWLNPPQYHIGDWGDQRGPAGGWSMEAVRLASMPPRRDGVDDTGWGAPYGQRFGFGSAHPLSLNVAFADRSVRPTKYTIGLPLFRYLGDRRDGQVINLSDL